MEIGEHLVRAITEGPLENPPWQTFVKALRARFEGNYACTFVRRPWERRTLEVFDSEGLSPDHHQRYFSLFGDREPIGYQALPPGRAFTIADLMVERVERTFYDDFLLPAGMADFVICCVDEPSGVRAGLVITRPPGAPGFTAEDAALLEAIGRHLSSSLRVFAAMKRAELKQLFHARATRSLAVGIILLDQNGRIIEMDDEARCKFERQTDLRVNKGWLRLRNRRQDAELRDRISKLLFQPLGLKRSMVMDVGGDAHLELLLCTVDPGVGFATAVAPRLAVYFSSIAEGGVIDAWQLAELYHLTNREAALAGLLARGLTLAESADELGITEQTARTYSKRIFLKTGVRRQTELVRRILTSVARLSGGEACPDPTPARRAASRARC